MEDFMIYIRGDIHGDVLQIIRWIYVESTKWETGQDVFLILTGDVGLNFFLDRRDFQRKLILQEALDELGERGIRLHILCVRGNHDCRPEHIYSYHLTEAFGGEAYLEDPYPGLLFLKDGQSYEIEGFSFFVIGGGNSSDIFLRLLNDEPFWQDEALSEKEMNDIQRFINLLPGQNVLLLSHMLPARFSLSAHRENCAGSSMEVFLDRIYEECHSKICGWYCGHYHKNVHFQDGNCNFFSLYKTTIQIA